MIGDTTFAIGYAKLWLFYSKTGREPSREMMHLAYEVIGPCMTDEAWIATVETLIRPVPNERDGGIYTAAFEWMPNAAAILSFASKYQRIKKLNGGFDPACLSCEGRVLPEGTKPRLMLYAPALKALPEGKLPETIIDAERVEPVPVEAPRRRFVL